MVGIPPEQAADTGADDPAWVGEDVGSGQQAAEAEQAGEAETEQAVEPEREQAVEPEREQAAEPSAEEPETEPSAEQAEVEPSAEEPETEPSAEEAEAAPAEERRITAGIDALAPENAGPGAAAFFDIDNTIMRGSSFAALAKGMADRDYFTTSEILEFTWKQLKYVVSGRENLDDIAQATENGLLFVKGRAPAEIRQLANEVYDETMVRRLWAGSVELAEAHRALGHEVWLISATPLEVAEEIARRLGLTGGLGTVAEVVGGVYTGRLDGPPLHGTAKVDVIRRIADERGLDLSRCAAYSDSSNDIPMLSTVGFPVAVNPDGPLRAHARRNGWPIRDYRIRGKGAVRRGVPAAAAATAAVGVAVGVAKAAKAARTAKGD